VLIAPPLAYGISPYFITYPGTLSLRPETFAAVVRDLLEDLLKQGFRRVLVNNGHGGNIGLLTALLVEMGNVHPDARFALFNWWTEAAVTAVAQEAGLPPNHANWMENFDFTRVGPVPEGEKKPVEFSHTASAAVTRAALGDGSFGGPYQAPGEIMERILAVAAEALAAMLRKL
jgi:creatinine amidohydrolase